MEKPFFLYTKPSFLMQEYNVTELHNEILENSIKLEGGYIMPPWEAWLRCRA
ncbi:hypothetical protein J7L29_05560 [Candidatus Bathyarchaeota archaeon]|nr:hypothetical protein [Candidatus Bathyarchaeota archaeon]